MSLTTHAMIQLAVFWALAFLSLGLALVLLNIFFALIGNDLELRSAGSEMVVAGICSLIEGLGFWLVITLIPGGSRALILPVLIVALIYKAAHYEDWGRFDIFMLLAFQTAIGFMAVSLFFGRFQPALFVLIGFGGLLTVIALCAKSLWD